MLTKERKDELVLNMTDTLWQIKGRDLIQTIGEKCGYPVPEDCYKLIEASFRSGAVLMERMLKGRN